MKALKAGVALAIAAAALPGTAQAATTIEAPTTVTPTIDNGPNFTIGFNQSNLANPFEAFLTFTTDLAGMLNIVVTTTATGTANDVDFSDVFLTGTGINAPVLIPQQVGDPNEQRALNFFQVGPGTYTVTFQGTPGTTSGSFGGSVAFQSMAAVPEPGTWALMLLGFGAVGFSMRRRRSATAHLYQAA